jgi:ElaB/YqjD/DUF883 family membrane-anchored ribosome-binding protein
MAKGKKDIDEQMADKAEELKSKGADKAEKIKGKGSDKYEEVIDRLYKQRNNLRKELDREYNEARRYVRSNPEEGLLVGAIGGFVMGILLSSWFK